MGFNQRKLGFKHPIEDLSWLNQLVCMIMGWLKGISTGNPFYSWFLPAKCSLHPSLGHLSPRIGKDVGCFSMFVENNHDHPWSRTKVPWNQSISYMSLKPLVAAGGAQRDQVNWDHPQKIPNHQRMNCCSVVSTPKFPPATPRSPAWATNLHRTEYGCAPFRNTSPTWGRCRPPLAGKSGGVIGSKGSGGGQVAPSEILCHWSSSCPWTWLAATDRSARRIAKSHRPGIFVGQGPPAWSQEIMLVFMNIRELLDIGHVSPIQDRFFLQQGKTDPEPVKAPKVEPPRSHFSPGETRKVRHTCVWVKSFNPPSGIQNYTMTNRNFVFTGSLKLPEVSHLNLQLRLLFQVLRFACIWLAGW